MQRKSHNKNKKANKISPKPLRNKNSNNTPKKKKP
jgi:hypothetical protein